MTSPALRLDQITSVYTIYFYWLFVLTQ